MKIQLSSKTNLIHFYVELTTWISMQLYPDESMHVNNTIIKKLLKLKELLNISTNVTRLATELE